jgi:hypothetical protein
MFLVFDPVRAARRQPAGPPTQEPASLLAG